MGIYEEYNIHETFTKQEWERVKKAFWDIWVCECGNCCSGHHCEDGAASRAAKSAMGRALGIPY